MIGRIASRLSWTPPGAGGGGDLRSTVPPLLLRGKRKGEEMTYSRPWTEDDIRRLKLLAGEGVSAQSIAKSLKRTIPSVLRKAQRLKLTLAWRPRAKGK